MKRVNNVFLMLILLFFLAGCDYDILWRDDPYQVYWIDNSSNKLGYSLGGGGIISRVDNVTAIGSNSRYVVVKSRRPGANKDEYYFINRSADSRHKEDSVMGAFSESAFVALKQKYRLPEFTKQF